MNSWSYTALNICVSVLTVQSPVALEITLFWACCIHPLSHDLLAYYLFMLNSSAWRQLFQIKHAKHWAGLASSTVHHLSDFCTVLRRKFEQLGHMSLNLCGWVISQVNFYLTLEMFLWRLILRCFQCLLVGAKSLIS